MSDPKTTARASRWCLSAAAQLGLMVGIGWAMWRFNADLWRSACAGTFRYSLSWYVCGNATAFDYRSLAYISVSTGFVTFVVLAPFLIKGRKH
jgi:hypothetical protein